MVDFKLIRRVEERIRSDPELSSILIEFYEKKRQSASITALLYAIERVLSCPEARKFFIEALKLARVVEESRSSSVIIVKRPLLFLIKKDMSRKGKE